MKLLHATWGEHCILRWPHPTRSSLAICVISPCSSGNTVSDFFRLSTSQWWVCEGDSNTFISWKSPHVLLEIMKIALERMSPLHSLCAHLAEKGCTFYATRWYAWKAYWLWYVVSKRTRMRSFTLVCGEVQLYIQEQLAPKTAGPQQYPSKIKLSGVLLWSVRARATSILKSEKNGIWEN